MKEHILPAIQITAICLLIFSGVYTLIVLAVSQLSFNNGKGEIIVANGKTYYTNVGQKFTDDKYFYSRPSAVDYNAAASGGSNKGPANPDYLKTVRDRIDTFLVHNPAVSKNKIPSDLVTASGAGLDPHISVQAATIQVKRIAKLRSIPEPVLQELISKNTEKPLLGFLGTERVHVLKLNLALDQLK